MIWKLFFVVYTLFYLLAIPWKIKTYESGKVHATGRIKLEEAASISFHVFGCLALFSLAFEVTVFEPLVWTVWLSIGIVWTCSPLVLKSPKLEVLEGKIPNKGHLFGVYLIGCLIVLPLYWAAYACSSLVT
ncbi:hypothetical protein [Paraferrimonas sedimenticola]|uniref:Uncharacterized protein n=1 Tax=Paraferrimonas sedimenticola TaxID=375674 RepID=A0AA37RWD3_9GAMM|nr:hypothetical protein [Paraferrimonas sedimenticola]GLP96531.1 hypothetical protein GCM10007895_18370 [Paraferrimonas sedimenticola]